MMMALTLVCAGVRLVKPGAQKAKNFFVINEERATRIANIPPAALTNESL
jgi:hypothetical protein